MVVRVENATLLVIFVNLLSIVTVAICFVQKVPQILTLKRLKSARGMSLVGLLLELYSYSITLCYNYRNGYAILSYLEYPILLIQDLIVIYYVLKYTNNITTKTMGGAFFYFSMFSLFFSGAIPREVLAFLLPFCTPIGASSKVIQLLEIVRRKNAESVSLITWFISAFTNFTRIFSILLDSMDVLLLLNFTISTLLSSSILIVAYYYRKNPGPDDDDDTSQLVEESSQDSKKQG